MYNESIYKFKEKFVQFLIDQLTKSRQDSSGNLIHPNAAMRKAAEVIQQQYSAIKALQEQYLQKQREANLAHNEYELVRQLIKSHAILTDEERKYVIDTINKEYEPDF